MRSSDLLHDAPSGKGVRSGFRNKLKWAHLPAKVQQQEGHSPLFPHCRSERCAEARAILTPCRSTLRVRNRPTDAFMG